MDSARRGAVDPGSAAQAQGTAAMHGQGSGLRARVHGTERGSR